MSDEDRVVAAVEERSDELVELASALIRFETTTRGELACPATVLRGTPRRVWM